MKFLCGIALKELLAVAPFVGAWIEIVWFGRVTPHLLVAPFVGAWIEIARPIKLSFKIYVAPFVGAWIEMWKLVLMFRLF